MANPFFKIFIGVIVLLTVFGSSEAAWENPRCNFTIIRWPFNDAKNAFFETLSPESLDEFQNLYKILNHDGLVDHLQLRLQDLEDLTTEQLLPGLVTYLINQDPSQVTHLCQNFVFQIFKPYKDWLEGRLFNNIFLVGKDFYDSFYSLKKHNSKPCKMFLKPFDVIRENKPFFKIIWNIGLDDFERLTYLIWLLEIDRQDFFMSVLYMAFTSSLILNSELIKHKIVPEVGYFLLDQNVGVIREWMEKGTGELDKLLSIVEKQQ